MCVRLQNKHESTPIEMANTIAVPIATAVRVPLRLQNTHEDPPPVSSDAKYTEKARKTLLAQAMHGVEPTKKELNKLKQQYFRKDYNAWLKRQERAKKRRVRDKEDEAVLAGIVAELGARAGAVLGAELGCESFGTLVRTLIQVEPPVRTLIQVEPRTSVDPRLRPCGADAHARATRGGQRASRHSRCAAGPDDRGGAGAHRPRMLYWMLCKPRAPSPSGCSRTLAKQN